MFLIDDILLAPLWALVYLFREVNNAAHQERVAVRGAITAELSNLYMMLETGQLTEEEFDVQERELLDRLDTLQEPTDDRKEPAEAGGRTR